MRDSFYFYGSFADAIEALPSEQQQLEMYKAIFEYAFKGKMPSKLYGTPKAMFSLIKTIIDLSPEVEEEE